MKHLFTLNTLVLALWSFSGLHCHTDTLINLPFQKLDNLILLEAEVHGKKGLFILDTGIPGVYLNARHFSGATEMVASDIVVGINGRAREVGLLTTDIKMHGIKQGIEAMVIDLSHLEKSKSVTILGQIGQSVFKGYELLFDLPGFAIYLIPLDRKGNRKQSPTFEHSYEIPFKMKGHLPVINAEMGEIALFLGFDTGAECNIIDPKYKDQVKVDPRWNKQAKLSSGWKSQQTVAYKVSGIQVSYMDCMPMLTIFSSMDVLNDQLYGHDLDGIIGTELLLQHKMSINYRKKMLYLWGEEGITENLISKAGKDKN